MLKTIPLSKLVPSPGNVRRTIDEQVDLELKADIEARGLLQKLVFTSAAKQRGRVAVDLIAEVLIQLAPLQGRGLAT